MQFVISDYLRYFLIILGIISSIVGIIKGILHIIELLRGIKRNKKDTKTIIIFLLIGIILIMVGTNLFHFFKCKHPSISITSPINNSYVNNFIKVAGKAYCLSPENKIVLLIHRKDQKGEPGKWFINPECASLERNIDWNLMDVEIGTENTQGYEFEIYAYSVNDSICDLIHQITQNTSYHGSYIKPVLIAGVHSYIIVKR